VNGRLLLPAVLISGVLQFFLGLPDIMKALFLLNALDVATGLFSAVVRRQFRGEVMLVGGAKKVFIWCVVAVGWVLDAHHILPDLPVDLASVVAGYYCVMEAASVLKHCAAVGVPLPEVLKGFVGGQGGQDTGSK